MISDWNHIISSTIKFNLKEKNVSYLYNFETTILIEYNIDKINKANYCLNFLIWANKILMK
jgi:ribosomal protein S26